MMDSESKYFDHDGNPCTLYQMIRREPEWMESRFTAMEAALAEKDREIALWKQAHRAADKDNIELREENAALTADIEELKRFVRDITLELQAHRKKTPTQMDMLFQKAYTLYAKHDVENRKAIKTVEK